MTAKTADVFARSPSIEGATPHPVLLSKTGLPGLQLKMSAFASECGWGEGTPEWGDSRAAPSPLPSASASGCGHSKVASSPRRAAASASGCGHSQVASSPRRAAASASGCGHSQVASSPRRAAASASGCGHSQVASSPRRAAASASGCGHSQVASSPRRACAGEGQGEGLCPCSLRGPSGTCACPACGLRQAGLG